MRYFLSLAVTMALLAKGIAHTTSAAGSVLAAGAIQALLPGQLGTTTATIQIATITPTTDDYLTMAAGTVVKSSACLHRHQTFRADENWTGRAYSETLHPSCENTVSGMASALTSKSGLVPCRSLRPLPSYLFPARLSSHVAGLRVDSPWISPRHPWRVDRVVNPWTTSLLPTGLPH